MIEILNIIGFSFVTLVIGFLVGKGYGQRKEELKHDNQQ